MSHRIAISFAAAVIGMACIATDASARGGGGGGKGGGPVRGVTAIKSYGPASPSFKGGASVRGVTAIKSYGPTGPGYVYRGVSVPVPAGATAVGTTGGTGGGAAAGARYYAPASYNSNAACGRYPYPPCKRVSPR